MALPVLQVIRLATVCHSYGLYRVSTGVANRTLSKGTPKAAAAIWAATVNDPWPISWQPMPSVSTPSSESSTQALDPALGGMAGAFHIRASPLPRRLFGALGEPFFPQPIAWAVFSR